MPVDTARRADSGKTLAGGVQAVGMPQLELGPPKPRDSDLARTGSMPEAHAGTGGHRPFDPGRSSGMAESRRPGFRFMARSRCTGCSIAQAATPRFRWHCGIGERGDTLPGCGSISRSPDLHGIDLKQAAVFFRLMWNFQPRFSATRNLPILRARTLPFSMRSGRRKTGTTVNAAESWLAIRIKQGSTARESSREVNLPCGCLPNSGGRDRQISPVGLTRRLTIGGIQSTHLNGI